MMTHRTLYLTGAMLVAATSTAHAGGMPQLDPSTFSSQIFWLVVAFSVLFILMWKGHPAVGT